MTLNMVIIRECKLDKTLSINKKKRRNQKKVHLNGLKEERESKSKKRVNFKTTH